jgi:excisionase family DNA binding protein
MKTEKNNMQKTVEIKTEKITLSVKEAAERTSLSPDYLWQLIRAGKLDAAHIGRRVLLTPESLENLINNGVK